MFSLALQGFDAGHAPLPPKDRLSPTLHLEPSSPTNKKQDTAASTTAATSTSPPSLEKPSNITSSKRESVTSNNNNKLLPAPEVQSPFLNRLLPDGRPLTSGSSKPTVGRHKRLKLDHVVHAIAPKRIQVKKETHSKTEGKIRQKEWADRPYLDQWLMLIEATLPGEPILSPPSTAPISTDKMIMSYRERTGFTAEGGLQLGSTASFASLQNTALSPNTGRVLYSSIYFSLAQLICVIGVLTY
jgi:hypothetical protein